MRSRAASALRAGLLALVCATAAAARAQETDRVSASTAMYVRTDTDQTTVVTPRIDVGAPLTDETRLDVAYMVDVWTSASIDIRTSASIGVRSPTPQKVTEQRDEIDVALEHALTDVTLGASYRYSVEHDYESHGGALGGAYDFADNSANVALSVRAYFDTVGRAGAADFAERATQYSARLAYTQILDPEMLAQLVYEAGLLEGYLSSPYRFVRFAMPGGPLQSTCATPVVMCRPENNPDSRIRHAVALGARRALGSALSVGANYRFYIDSWELTSHTVAVDAALAPDGGFLFSLGYRLYRQSSASHFAPFYTAMPLPSHYTSDKELSALTSHRVELEVTKSFELDAQGSRFAAVLLVAPSYFLYHEFLLVDTISALEVTLGLEVSL